MSADYEAAERAAIQAESRSPMLAAAIAAARRSFPIFPVSPDKTPLTRHGHLDATTDEQQIEQWWRAHPDANIGARCTWFFVVDVDPRSGGHHVLDGWRRVRGEFPQTWKAITGSRGWHFYFKHDPALDAVPLGKLYRGLDIKGGGRGYVLLPPSRNRNGAYKWIVAPRDTSLARAPRWLIQEITTAKRPREAEPIKVDVSKYAGIDRVERARKYVQTIPGAIEGQGGDRDTWIAANKIARGFALSEAEAFDVLASEFNPRCQPRWSAEDLRRHVKRALAIGNMPIGELLKKGRAA